MDITIPKDSTCTAFTKVPVPIAAEVQFVVPAGVKSGGLQSLTKPREYFDDIFGITARDFGGKVTMETTVLCGNIRCIKITGKYSYQLCQERWYVYKPIPKNFGVNTCYIA